MSQEFNKLVSYIEVAKKRYFFALSMFYAYEGLCDQLAPNIVGDKMANENVKIFRDFNNFLSPSKEALRVYFFLELAKLFDAADGSLHITKIVNYTQSNIAKLTAADFAEYDQDREFVDILVADYQGISREDLLVIKKELEDHQGIIEKIKTYRDKFLAHDDIKKPEIEITGEEIRAVLNLLEKVLNLFSSRLISTTSIYDHIEDDTKAQISTFVDHLKRFEPYRIEEVNHEAEEFLRNN